MQGNVPEIVWVFVLLGILAPVLYIHVARSQKLLKRWADENGFELLHVEHRMFRKGPFVFSSRGQSVYRVEVRDAQGLARKGWVRCGSWWAGLLSDQVEARWDEQ